MNKKYKLQVHEKTYLVELEETDNGLVSVVIETESGNTIKKDFELERSDDEQKKFSVIIDGKAHLVELEKLNTHRLSFSILLDGKPHIVDAIPVVSKEMVSSTGNNFLNAFNIHDSNSLTVSNNVAGGVAEGAVKAPLVGTVVSIKINPGDPVSQGEVLLIIDAMKMENEIRTPKTGIIKEIKAVIGKRVKMGEILVVIE